MDPRIHIVFEDSNLLVLNKPQDLVCHPTKSDAYSSLIGRIRLHLGEQAEAHMINRLDRETSGIVIIAKNLPTARAWRSCWEKRDVQKRYLAIIHGHPATTEGTIDAPLGKDVHSPVAIKDCVRADGSPAQTSYRVLHTFHQHQSPFALLSVEPKSGRKHQIRIHLAHLGHPIVGDKLYGANPLDYLDFVSGTLSPERRQALILPNHALHAASIEANILDQRHHYQCPMPREMHDFLPVSIASAPPVL